MRPVKIRAYLFYPQKFGVKDKVATNKGVNKLRRSIGDASPKQPTKSPSTLTIEESLEKAGFGFWHILALVSISVLVSSFYTKLEEVNILGQKLLCIWDLQGYEEAFLTSSFFAGAIFGAMIWGKFSDVYGKSLSPNAVLRLKTCVYPSKLSLFGQCFPRLLLTTCQFDINQ